MVSVLAQIILDRQPNPENYLDLIFAAPLCEKVIIVLDTNYITSAIRKFMLDLPSHGSFQYGPLNLSPIGLSACETMWFKLCKIKQAQLKISLYNTQSDSVLIADQN